MTTRTKRHTRGRRVAALAPLLLLPLLLPGCGRATAGAGASGSPGVAAYVLEARDLSGGVPLWASLSGRVPGVRAFDAGDGCPKVILRRVGQASSVGEPAIYVDGTRTWGTCALGDIEAWDVDRVEVYPGGVAHRPGYPSHSAGLILIFTRGS